MRERKKRKSHIAKASANVIKFCEILDDLPVDFRFELKGVSKDFDGTWKKRASDGTTSWQNGYRILFNSSFFHKRNQVLEAYGLKRRTRSAATKEAIKQGKG